jgi:FMN reductase
MPENAGAGPAGRAARGSPSWRPLVVGIGGSGRPGSATDRALRVALRGAELLDADTHVFDGTFLSGLPLFVPHAAERCDAAADFTRVLAMADGVIIATPSYHGCVSAMVKNSLDYIEDLRADPRPYLDGRAVGCVVTSSGWQAGGTTLTAVRSIVHALRGWPTPLGVLVQTEYRDAPAARPVEPEDRYTDPLLTVGRQVTEFAQATAGLGWAGAGAPR